MPYCVPVFRRLTGLAAAVSLVLVSARRGLSRFLPGGELRSHDGCRIHISRRGQTTMSTEDLKARVLRG